eukprot:CAMPEP_0113936196 /NCGR_PEP_ID=MMETSP1339-20121228/3163_1 /TAXON_ID=94617 /ORGANISM="Fibrocapsa japonica" /LENGTH=154 /DNA_ID=CAMNT_0000938581 /DNA_START=18 /DNA_END=482 /DNA_ORIENTATION=+ /assembly_acc=CAM_ASM_000762
MQAGEAKALHTRTQSSGLNVSEEVQQAWEAFRAEDSLLQWCWFSYEEGGSKKVVVKEIGNTGYDGMVASFSEDDVAFCGFSANVDGNKKLFRVFFIGENVGGMKRGKAGMHKNAVFDKMPGCSADVVANSLSDLEREKTIEFIIQKLQSNSVEL